MADKTPQDHLLNVQDELFEDSLDVTVTEARPRASTSSDEEVQLIKFRIIDPDFGPDKVLHSTHILDQGHRAEARQRIQDMPEDRQVYVSHDVLYDYVGNKLCEFKLIYKDLLEDRDCRRQGRPTKISIDDVESIALLLDSKYRAVTNAWKEFKKTPFGTEQNARQAIINPLADLNAYRQLCRTQIKILETHFGLRHSPTSMSSSMSGLPSDNALLRKFQQVAGPITNAEKLLEQQLQDNTAQMHRMAESSGAVDKRCQELEARLTAERRKAEEAQEQLRATQRGRSLPQNLQYGQQEVRSNSVPPPSAAFSGSAFYGFNSSLQTPTTSIAPTRFLQAPILGPPPVPSFNVAAPSFVQRPFVSAFNAPATVADTYTSTSLNRGGPRGLSFQLPPSNQPQNTMSFPPPTFQGPPRPPTSDNNINPPPTPPIGTVVTTLLNDVAAAAKTVVENSIRQAANSNQTPYLDQGSQLNEKYFDEMGREITIDEYYMSLPNKWAIIPNKSGPILQPYKVRDSSSAQFTGKRFDFEAWRARNKVSIMQQRMPVEQKAYALMQTIDYRNDPQLASYCRAMRYDCMSFRRFLFVLERNYGGEELDLTEGYNSVTTGKFVNLRSLSDLKMYLSVCHSYKTLLISYGRLQLDWTPSGPLFRAMVNNKISPEDINLFTKHCKDHNVQKGPESLIQWLDYLLQILEESATSTHKGTGVSDAAASHTTQQSITKSSVLTTVNTEEFPDQTSVEQDSLNEQPTDSMQGQVDHQEEIPQDETDENVQHIIMFTQQTGYKVRKMPACDFKGNPCQEDHLLKNCSKFMSLSQKDRLSHLFKVKRCLNCFNTGHFAIMCKSNTKCRTCQKKHNTLIHEAWGDISKSTVLLTAQPLVSLHTSPVGISLNKKGDNMIKTIMIHDDAATMSIISKELANKLQLQGLMVWVDITTVTGNSKKLVPKALIQVFNHEGQYVHDAEVHIMSEFVDIKAADWSVAKDAFDHFTDVPFPPLPEDRKCHLLIGNDNPHLIAPSSSRTHTEKHFPYALCTPLGWTAAGPTTPRPQSATTAQLVDDAEQAQRQAVFLLRNPTFE